MMVQKTENRKHWDGQTKSKSKTGRKGMGSAQGQGEYGI